MGRQQSSENSNESTPKRGRLMYEGRSKRVFETTEPDIVHLEFKTEFGQKEEDKSVPQKSICAAKISEHVYVRNRDFQQERFGTVALPLYVVMSPDDKEVTRFPGMTRQTSEFVDFLQQGKKQSIVAAGM